MSTEPKILKKKEPDRCLIAHSRSSPLYSLFLPLRIEPYTDGYSWARKAGLDSHSGMRQGEELTDSDEE